MPKGWLEVIYSKVAARSDVIWKAVLRIVRIPPETTDNLMGSIYLMAVYLYMLLAEIM